MRPLTDRVDRGPRPVAPGRWLPRRGEHPPPSWSPAGASNPLDGKLGIEIVDYDPDRLAATMPVDRSQGGRHRVERDYIRSATSGVVTAVCTPARRGRTLATFLIDVRDDQGRPTAGGRLT